MCIQSHKEQLNHGPRESEHGLDVAYQVDALFEGLRFFESQDHEVKWPNLLELANLLFECIPVFPERSLLEVAEVLGLLKQLLFRALVHFDIILWRSLKLQLLLLLGLSNYL